MGFGKLGTFSCEACTTKWFLGESGTCDLNTSTCVCPEGFSGKDDLVVTQTCHVNESALVLVEYISFFVLLIALFLTILAFASIYRKYRTKTEPDKVLWLSLLSIAFGIPSLICFTAIFGIHAFSGEKVSHVDYRYVLPNLAGFGVIFLSMSFSLTIFSWYKSLPDPSQFGRLLNFSPIIVKYHDRIYHLFVLNTLSWCLMMLICLIILPLFDETENFEVLSTSILLFYFPFGLMAYLMLTLISINSLSGMYTHAREVVEKLKNHPCVGLPNRITRRKGRIDDIIVVLFYMKCICIGSLLFCLLFLGCIILTGGLYQYIFLSGSQFIFSISSTISMQLTWKRTSGGLRMRISSRDNRSQNTISSM